MPETETAFKDKYTAVTEDGKVNDIDKVEVKRVFGGQPHEWETLTVDILKNRIWKLNKRITEITQQIIEYQQHAKNYNSYIEPVREEASKVKLKKKL